MLILKENMLQKASKLITKRSTPMDGQLFLIKHLLILREQVISLIPPSLLLMWCLFYQVICYMIFDSYKFAFQIAPFDIEFSVTHKELDFSHLLVSFSGASIAQFERIWCLPF